MAIGERDTGLSLRLEDRCVGVLNAGAVKPYCRAADRRSAVEDPPPPTPPNEPNPTRLRSVGEVAASPRV